jgi:peroxiredoxin
MEIGDLIPYFSLRSHHGHEITPWDYKQKRNLVILFFVPGGDDLSLLKGIAEKYDEFRTLNTEVLAMAEGGLNGFKTLPGESEIPFPVLFDEEGRVSSRYLTGEALPSVFVSDRFGTLHFQKLGIRREEVLSVLKEVESTLSYIESRCPECSI